MSKEKYAPDDFPVISDLKDFDRTSGDWLERLFFNNRVVWIIIFVLITLGIGSQALQVKMEASYEKMIPQGHRYIDNYMKYKEDMPSLSNMLRIVVENKEGDILEPEYLENLKYISNEVFLITGVDRAWVKSLWTPSVRWNTVTEEGFEGGAVMPADYDGSDESLKELKTNIFNAGIVGSLVANDLKSSMIQVPLLGQNPETGEPVDYTVLCEKLKKITSEVDNKENFEVHVIGFAKLVSVLISSLDLVLLFFGITIIIAILLIYVYTRCVRSTVVVILCSLAAVLLQLGVLVLLGYPLDPYSILVPFLVFAIAVSHGVQRISGFMRDFSKGNHKVVASRYSFRRLFKIGLIALLTDALGFAVLMTINVPIIQNLAILASIGVGVIIITNLIILPLLMSFTGVSMTGAERTYQAWTAKDGYVTKISNNLAKLTERRWSYLVIGVAVIITAISVIIMQDLQVGDLDPGAPELRENSTYNRDVAYISDHYSLSSDVFAVIVDTPPYGALEYETLTEMDSLSSKLAQMPRVDDSLSLAKSIKQVTAGTADGSLKWYTIPRNKKAINFAVTYSLQLSPELSNHDMSVMPLISYLKDHKAQTLNKVVAEVEEFAKAHNTENRKFLLASGNAGVEAATNIVVERANIKMVVLIYSVVVLLLLIAFRTWRIVPVAVIPLAITSALCSALMVIMGVGVKVSTLPVIALGVGVGVDYALYLVGMQLQYQRTLEISLEDAYRRALLFTGKNVILVSATFSLGVITWIFSPIKFQADMGILLTFMFVWNMFGAVLLTPALSHFFMQTRSISGRKIADDKNV